MTMNGTERFADPSMNEVDHASKRRKTGPVTLAQDPLHNAVDRQEDAEVGILQLETDEVISEVAVDPNSEATVNALLQRLIHDLPKLAKAEIDTKPVKGLLEDLGFELQKPFNFEPPSAVAIVGSYDINAACKPSPYIDLAVQIPTSSLDSKDQLNHRYHAKRALYLSHLRKALSKLPEVKSVDWSPGFNAARRPTLLLKLQKGTSSSGLSIRILPTLAPDAFPKSKLGPDRNNLRSAVDDDGKQVPTPHYNASVLQDMSIIQHAQWLKRVSENVPHFSAAVVLLKAWMRQQRLNEGSDGVSGFFLTMMLAYVLEKGQASPGMSAIHLFRATLQALSNPKPLTSGIALQSTTTRDGGTKSPPSVKSFRSPTKNTAVFIDPTGWLNIGTSISTASLQQLANAAARTAAAIPSGGPEAFDSAFFLQRPLSSLFDLWYHIHIPTNASSQHKDALAGDVPVWRQQEDTVRALLVKALGNRAIHVRALGRKLLNTNESPFDPKSHASIVERSYVLVGVRTDAPNAFRTVDMGPSADSGNAAKAFREFWGEKSELRRFVDGSIREAVVWEDYGPEERHLVTDSIVEYILTKHLPQGTRVVSWAGILDSALHRSGRDETSSMTIDIEDERACVAAAERLSKKLRAVTELPLKVVSVQPLAAVTRHAALYPPTPHPLAGAPGGLNPSVDIVPRCLEPVELLCQLEGTGRWPDAVEPYEKMKAALGVQLAMELQKGFGIEAQATESYIDVFSDGFAFRLRLSGERDEIMQKKALAEASMEYPPPVLDIPLRVWHQGIVSAAAAANPAFQQAVRLAKRWTAAHLLSPHLQEEAVELITVAAFRPDPVQGNAPSTPISGFLRFLLVLSNHPWAVQPLVLASAAGETVAAEQREIALKAHTAQRDAGTAAAMFITGPQADACVGWTRNDPSSSMLWRIVVLAERSAKRLENVLVRGGGFDKTVEDTKVVAAIFSRDFTDYDLVIRLRSDAIPYPDRGNTKDMKAAKKAGQVVASGSTEKLCRAILKGIPADVIRSRGVGTVRKELLVGFDPIKIFVNALQNRFNSVASFCTDYTGGCSVIGVKWMPLLVSKEGVGIQPEIAHALKAMEDGPSSVQGDEAVVSVATLDQEAVIADIQEIGAGLIDDIILVQQQQGK